MQLSTASEKTFRSKGSQNSENKKGIISYQVSKSLPERQAEDQIRLQKALVEELWAQIAEVTEGKTQAKGLAAQTLRDNRLLRE